jgi:peptidoglycan hydrolase-like protein with peptidoglycan-binding domain
MPMTSNTLLVRPTRLTPARDKEDVMRSRAFRYVLGFIPLLLAAAVAMPMSPAQAGPTVAAAKSGAATNGSVGNSAIIPGLCEYTSSQPTLRRGSSGTAVRQAQCEYNWATRGTNIAVDGSFGSITDSAIRHFQRCVHITADGIVGPVTWSRLNYWASSPGYPPGC